MKNDLVVPQSMSALVDVDVAMTWLDMTLVPVFESRMGGNQCAVLEDAQLFGQRVYLDDTAPGGVGHAVEIAADADHALPADTSLEL